MPAVHQRDSLLDRYRASRARYDLGLQTHVDSLSVRTEIWIDDATGAFTDTAAYRDAREAYAEIIAIENEYFRSLPRLVMAPCPHCERPLYRSFDPFGLDGLWWRSDAQPEEPTPCPHFCVLLGAVNLGDHLPQLEFDVHPGPGAPFVMPRLMTNLGMTAVVSEIPLVDGAVAYPIAYFAPKRPPAQTLTASWARTNYVYTTQLGEHGWRRAEEPSSPTDGTWDFDLLPWLTSGELRWCDPGSDRTKLSDASAETCPFLALPGRRVPQLLP
jgi:hypothetical protein